jgi:hypothetical protein
LIVSCSNYPKGIMPTKRVVLLTIVNILIFLQISSVTSFVSAIQLNSHRPSSSFVRPLNLHTNKIVAQNNVDTRFTPPYNTVVEEVSGGQASLASSTFNLAKSIVGAGVLSLPAGVAFFSDSPSALLPASIICAVFGIVAAYSFSSIGRVCRDTKSHSFQEAWEKTVDKNSAWLISGSITSMCFLASLTYSIVIGDAFSALAKVIISLFFFLVSLLTYRLCFSLSSVSFLDIRCTSSIRSTK